MSKKLGTKRRRKRKRRKRRKRKQSARSNGEKSHQLYVSGLPSYSSSELFPDPLADIDTWQF
jgi:hypothetical protein